MSNLFKKAAVFTDIHWGLKNNSLVHNQDCLSFVEWFIANAKKEKCETCFFLGDWNHHRASINIQTMQFGLRALEKLVANFNHVYFIPGNHDLYYREQRDIHSVEWAKHLPNLTIVNDFFNEGDVIISPWLLGEEHEKLAKMKAKYLFGHFEFPKFYMNAMVEMADHGAINETHVSNFDLVFSGHFHKRQFRKNIWYIGNAFPHDYADKNDDDRGMMILEWGKNPVFHSWPDQPTFREYKLSSLVESPDKLLLPNANIRVELDVDISYEEAITIKETLMPMYKLRDMSMIPIKKNEHGQDLAPGDLKVDSVDAIIIDQISKIESEFYDKKILMDIYTNL